MKSLIAVLFLMTASIAHAEPLPVPGIEACRECKVPQEKWPLLGYDQLRRIFNGLSAIYSINRAPETGYLANRAYELMLSKERYLAPGQVRNHAQLLEEQSH